MAGARGSCAGRLGRDGESGRRVRRLGRAILHHIAAAGGDAEIVFADKNELTAESDQGLVPGMAATSSTEPSVATSKGLCNTPSRPFGRAAASKPSSPV